MSHPPKVFHEHLRYCYPLTPESVIIEAGTHQGKWCAQMAEKYRCRIFTFEPIQAFWAMANERLRGHSSVTLSNCGLASTNRTEKWHVKGELTGAHNGEGEEEEVILVDFVGWLHAMANSLPDVVDLLEINIEGGEYELLEAIIARGQAHRFRNIQVQFHGVGLSPVERRRGIRASLDKTHRLTWDEPFVWENWELLP